MTKSELMKQLIKFEVSIVGNTVTFNNGLTVIITETNESVTLYYEIKDKRYFIDMEYVYETLLTLSELKKEYYLFGKKTRAGYIYTLEIYKEYTDKTYWCVFTKTTHNVLIHEYKKKGFETVDKVFEHYKLKRKTWKQKQLS